MNTNLVKIAVTLWVMGPILGLILAVSKASGQMETCPYGYYLATNNLCYQYPQQQATMSNNSATTAIDQDLIHICKINRDMIAVDKGLGDNTSQLSALVNLYNDVCGTVTGVK